MNRVGYQVKIAEILDNALNELDFEQSDILIKSIKEAMEYVDREEMLLLETNKGWRVSSCYRLYDFAKRTANRSGHKYSMTKDEEYLKIRREASKILTLLEEKDLNEVNLDETYDRISELYIQIRKLNEKE